MGQSGVLPLIEREVGKVSTFSILYRVEVREESREGMNVRNWETDLLCHGGKPSSLALGNVGRRHRGRDKLDSRKNSSRNPQTGQWQPKGHDVDPRTPLLHSCGGLVPSVHPALRRGRKVGEGGFRDWRLLPAEAAQSTVTHCISRGAGVNTRSLFLPLTNR